MTTLRPGLGPPSEPFPSDELERLCAYLDRQRRIELAAWASHDHRTPDGVAQDGHVLLGIPDDDWHGENAYALEMGLLMEVSHPHPGWVDIFALSEKDTVKGFAEILWERMGEPSVELDPLDFTFTWDPVEPSPPALERFGRLMKDVPGVRRVEATYERLWRNGAEFRSHMQMYVAFDERRPHDFDHVQNVLREAGISMENSGMSAGLPVNEKVRTAVLFER